MTTLIIARHGNTFKPHQIPTRVGARTDLPLVGSGYLQAEAIGNYLKEHGLLPQSVFTSGLKRTIETAVIALEKAGHASPISPRDFLNEIDYGPDENQKEADVIKRIGEQAIKDWDDHADVPDGWKVDPPTIIRQWKKFGEHMIRDFTDQTIMAVTSNGIARFAPYMTGDFDTFAQNHKIKISTGALCILDSQEDGTWHVREWNLKPKRTE